MEGVGRFMANVYDVAAYILHEKGAVSGWKLQKLCYYCQAWSLAWTEHPLFPEDFQAWSNWPVCPPLFHQHKGHFTVSEQNISQKLLSPEGLTGDQKDTIDKVLEHYGDWEPYELRERSHDEDPWKNARGGIPEDAPSCQVISKESMGEYYGSL